MDFILVHTIQVKVQVGTLLINLLAVVVAEDEVNVEEIGIIIPRRKSIFHYQRKIISTVISVNGVIDTVGIYIFLQNGKKRNQLDRKNQKVVARSLPVVAIKGNTIFGTGVEMGKT